MRRLLLAVAVSVVLPLVAQPARSEIVRRSPVLAPAVRPTISAVATLRTPELLRSLNRQVTLRGYYYDGSIPMIIDNFERTKCNMMIPPEAYVPLAAPAAGVNSGDSIEVTGLLEAPKSGDSIRVRQESAVLRVGDPTKLRVLQASPAPRVAVPIAGLADRYKGLTPSRPGLGSMRLAAPVKYAVLISGGISWANNHPRYWNELKAMYDILLARGYEAANITVLYADGAPLAPGMPVNFAATKQNIINTFTQLASKVGPADTVYIMTEDHGASGSSDANGDEVSTHRDEVLRLWRPTTSDADDMTDDEFAAAVNKITSYQVMIIQMEQCFSGGLIDDLTRPNRIIISACRPNESSWGGPDFNAFTYWYLAALAGNRPDGAGAVNADTNGDGQVSIAEAFEFARSHDTAPETPQYEDNGALPAHEGVTPGGGEGALGASTFLN